MTKKSFNNDLASCISAGVAAVAVTSHEWERVAKTVKVIATAKAVGYAQWDALNGLVVDGESVPGSNSNPLAALQELFNLKDAVVVFENFNDRLKLPAVIAQMRELLAYAKCNGVCVVFVSVSGEFPSELEKEILLLEFPLPMKEEIEGMINGLGNYSENEYFPKLTEAAIGLGLSEAENIIAMSLVQNGLDLNEVTVQEVKRQKASALKKSGVLELYEPSDLPKVGGLDQLQMWLWEREKAFSPEAKEFGLPAPKGILVFGIPGTGKSLAMKHIAQRWGMQLLLMGNILDKYVGESEKRMKEALKIAERMAPCVLAIDEIEKFFSGVGGSSDSGVSTRIFGQFLSWMQETTAPVFVVATANNVAGLPPELMRKGRFDEIWFVDLPGQKEREEIFKIHIMRKNRKVEDFDIPLLAKETAGYTGSEIEQVVISGLFRAFSKGQDIDTQTLIEAAEETFPLSATMKESISSMREWGKTRARLAATPDIVNPETQVNAFTRKLRL